MVATSGRIETFLSAAEPGKRIMIDESSPRSQHVVRHRVTVCVPPDPRDFPDLLSEFPELSKGTGVLSPGP